MASLDHAEEALRSTNAKANFQRLTRLLMCGGVKLLRETFDSIHSPADLPLKLVDPAIQVQLRGARLTQPEWDCLYPSPGVYGKSIDFDITLVFRLLRTICNLTPPPGPRGWDVLPNSTDHSLEADLVRIKYFRNEVYGHNKTMEILDNEFVRLWEEISEALLRIAANISVEKRDEWKKSIDDLLRDPLTPDEERCIEELYTWYKHDMNVKNELEKLSEKITDTIEEKFNTLQEELRSQRPELIGKSKVVNTPEKERNVGLTRRFSKLLGRSAKPKPVKPNIDAQTSRSSAGKSKVVSTPEKKRNTLTRRFSKLLGRSAKPKPVKPNTDAQTSRIADKVAADVSFVNNTSDGKNPLTRQTSRDSQRCVEMLTSFGGEAGFTKRSLPNPSFTETLKRKLPFRKDDRLVHSVEEDLDVMQEFWGAKKVSERQRSRDSAQSEGGGEAGFPKRSSSLSSFTETLHMLKRKLSLRRDDPLVHSVEEDRLDVMKENGNVSHYAGVSSDPAPNPNVSRLNPAFVPSNPATPSVSPSGIPDINRPQNGQIIKILQHPQTQNRTEGSRVVLTCRCEVQVGTEVSYQWYKDDEELQGRTTPALVLDSVRMRDFGCYKSQMTHLGDASEGVKTNPAVLDVTPLPERRLKTLQEVKLETRDEVATRLESKPLGTGGWREIACQNDMKEYEIQILQNMQEPGKKVIEFLLASKPNLTVYSFCKTLKGDKMKRFDIAKVLEGDLVVEKERTP